MCISNSHCLVFLVLFGSTPVMSVISGRCCVAVCACVCSASSVLCLLLCGVGFLLAFSHRVASSLSPGLQNYFPQRTQCYFVMSFLRNYFPRQSGCLLVKVILNLLFANWQDWFFFCNASELNVNYHMYRVRLTCVADTVFVQDVKDDRAVYRQYDKCKWSCELASGMSGFPRGAGGRCCGLHSLLTYAGVLLLLEATSEMDAGSGKDRNVARQPALCWGCRR